MDGDELQYSEFEAGKINILPPQREKLDAIAKMMIKRPKIQLGIAGTYDEVIDKRALQEEKLISLVLKESGIENRSEHKSAMTIDMLEDIYEDIKDDDRLEKIENELEEKYEGVEFESKYRQAIIEETVKIQIVTLEELQRLAKKRSDVVINYLTLDKGVSIDRLNALEIKKAEDSTKTDVKINFEIEVK